MSDDTTNVILEAARGEPKTVAQLVEVTGLGETTIRNTTKELEEAGRLEKLSANGRAVAFGVPATDTSEETQDTPKAEPGEMNRREAAAARDEQIFKAVAEEDGITRRDLAEKVDIKDSLVSMTLWRLCKAERVEKVRNGTRSPVWQAK